MHGLPPGDAAQDLLDPAWQMRWRVPELALVLSDRAVAQARRTGDRALRLRAEVLALFTTNRLGRGVSATGRAIAALRDAETAGEAGVAAELRVELACCARSAGSNEVAVRVLEPVLAQERLEPLVRAHALLALAAALPFQQSEGERAEALEEADRLYIAAELNRDANRLMRARVKTARAGHHRRQGEFPEAVDAADSGLGLLQRLGDPAADSGEIHARLVLERVQSLLELGRRDEAVSAADEVLSRPVRAAAAGPSGWLRLALATRVYQPEGAHLAAVRVLNDAIAIAERHKLDGLLAETLSTLSNLHERADELAEALLALRRAYAADRRWRAAVHAARLRLLEEFPALVQGVEPIRKPAAQEVPTPRREQPSASRDQAPLANPAQALADPAAAVPKPGAARSAERQTSPAAQARTQAGGVPAARTTPAAEQAPVAAERTTAPSSSAASASAPHAEAAHAVSAHTGASHAEPTYTGQPDTGASHAEAAHGSGSAPSAAPQSRGSRDEASGTHAEPPAGRAQGSRRSRRAGETPEWLVAAASEARQEHHARGSRAERRLAQEREELQAAAAQGSPNPTQESSSLVQESPNPTQESPSPVRESPNPASVAAHEASVAAQETSVAQETPVAAQEPPASARGASASGTANAGETQASRESEESLELQQVRALLEAGDLQKAREFLEARGRQQSAASTESSGSHAAAPHEQQQAHGDRSARERAPHESSPDEGRRQEATAEPTSADRGSRTTFSEVAHAEQSTGTPSADVGASSPLAADRSDEETSQYRSGDSDIRDAARRLMATLTSRVTEHHERQAERFMHTQREMAAQPEAGSAHGEDDFPGQRSGFGDQHGLGAGSYGTRHADPTEGYAARHGDVSQDYSTTYDERAGQGADTWDFPQEGVAGLGESGRSGDDFSAYDFPASGGSGFAGERDTGSTSFAGHRDTGFAGDRDDASSGFAGDRDTGFVRDRDTGFAGDRDATSTGFAGDREAGAAGFASGSEDAAAGGWPSWDQSSGQEEPTLRNQPPVDAPDVTAIMPVIALPPEREAATGADPLAGGSERHRSAGEQRADAPSYQESTSYPEQSSFPESASYPGATSFSESKSFPGESAGSDLAGSEFASSALADAGSGGADPLAGARSYSAIESFPDLGRASHAESYEREADASDTFPSLAPTRGADAGSGRGATPGVTSETGVAADDVAAAESTRWPDADTYVQHHHHGVDDATDRGARTQEPQVEGGRRSRGRTLEEIRASLRLVEESRPQGRQGRRRARHAEPDDDAEPERGSDQRRAAETSPGFEARATAATGGDAESGAAGATSAHDADTDPWPAGGTGQGSRAAASSGLGETFAISSGVRGTPEATPATSSIPDGASTAGHSLGATVPGPGADAGPASGRDVVTGREQLSAPKRLRAVRDEPDLTPPTDISTRQRRAAPRAAESSRGAEAAESSSAANAPAEDVPISEIGLADLLAEALVAYETGRRSQGAPTSGAAADPDYDAAPAGRHGDTNVAGITSGATGVPGAYLSTSDAESVAAEPRHRRAAIDSSTGNPRSWPRAGN
ncbi:cell wall anchor protein [Saccharopolyspora erythraea]|uniref:cell wall anchor protein n=1 Tax=Saccharopolyspora erythraea TaxID=1836 RepID=UPI00117A5FA4|nr:cell wall anchor protein [Saccharopolyspora erythraea]QRK91195.1 cell wall anchor protein [Saccharopolyspora erythraea]